MSSDSTIIYVAKPGDYLVKIAQEHGTTWEAIWLHPLNADHRRKRGSPDALGVGDVLHVPCASAPSPELPPPPAVPGPPAPPVTPAGPPPWPYAVEPVEPPRMPTWECPEGICVCHERLPAKQAEFSVLLFDGEGRRMPGARCRVLVGGLEVNLDQPYANPDGWVTVVLEREPELIQVQWAPADTPIDPRYPYRKRCYVRLRQDDRQEAGRRRLHNLGFGKRRTLRRNVEDFQRHFDYTAVTGELPDVEDELRLYHDAGCMPAVTDRELEERIREPTRSSGGYTAANQPGKPMPRKVPAPPPGPPPSHGHPRVGGGTPIGQAACAPWQQPRPLLPILLKLVNRDGIGYTYRPFRVSTTDEELGPFETGADGEASFEVPADTRFFRVTLWPGDPRHPGQETIRWTFYIDALAPASTVRGATTRLRHLDYWSGGLLDQWTEDARGALRAFQSDHGIPTTGSLDGPTCARLEQACTATASGCGPSAGGETRRT